MNANKSVLLPLLLWNAPPGCERILQQEGVPFQHFDPNHPQTGRFLIGCDLESIHPSKFHLTSIDLKELDLDHFRHLLDTRPGLATWKWKGLSLQEKIARQNHSKIKRHILDWLRTRIEQAGGVWARLALFPHPYRSAFHFRVDMDEPYPDDYFRFAKARSSIEDCVTHFVSTWAYETHDSVLDDLTHVDCQSHGHFHKVFREEQANLRNLKRADQVLRDRGIEPNGYAGPEGRWNEGLDRSIQKLGYSYSSEFQAGWDAWPYHPWLSDEKTFSKTWQIPVHPICEGLFFEAGATESTPIIDHYLKMLEQRINAGIPTFLYGHPERRLGRFPEIVEAIAGAVNALDGVWRVTMGQFADWSQWRSQRRWSLTRDDQGRLEATMENWDTRYAVGLEIVQSSKFLVLPWIKSKEQWRPDPDQFQPLPKESGILDPDRLEPLPTTWRTRVRDWLDWEKQTPIEELEATVQSPRDWIKAKLRRWQSRQEGIHG